MVSYSSSRSPVNNCPTSAADQAAFEADKRAVYKHPLFPLLALVFERCEQATQCIKVPVSEEFNMDIQAFVQHQQKDRKPFFTDDAEVDGLMIEAIQVLRIHLLELEKVQELCKDFCTRYITCLKSKMQSENLLKPDYIRSPPAVEGNNACNGHFSGNSSPVLYSPRPFQVVSNLAGNTVSTTAAAASAAPVLCREVNECLPKSYELPTGTTITLSNEDHNSSTSQEKSVTAMEQISTPPSAMSSRTASGSFSPTSGTSCDENEDHCVVRKKQKRGILPKYATSIMRSWLFQHLVHPYPTEDEKKHIALQTNLTLLQVNNWFINARRRILQPMLDASDKKDIASVTFGESDTEASSGDESNSGQNTVSSHNSSN